MLKHFVQISPKLVTVDFHVLDCSLYKRVQGLCLLPDGLALRQMYSMSARCTSCLEPREIHFFLVQPQPPEDMAVSILYLHAGPSLRMSEA